MNLSKLMTNDDLIKHLGLAKCREILNGAPDWAVFWITRNEYHISVLTFPNMTDQHSYLIADLRKALSEHDTDHCSDIRNHISPLTVVIER